MKKKNIFVFVITIVLLITIAAIIKPFKSKDNLPTMQDEIIVKENATVSMFSWYFEFTNQGVFYQLSEPFTELGVTRLYQLFPVEYLKKPQVPVMVQNLSEMDIETVLLTGDKNWVLDGLEEYRQMIDELSAYNDSVGEELKINSVALDVEAHTLPEWQENPKDTFRKYIDLMKQAKEYANAHGLQVIQIVPTHYDKVSKKLFTEFLLNCCDELSIMNYNKKNSFSAISTEVKLCKKYDIPVETIFETMPISEEHAVTEQMTYYYDGIDILKEDVAKIKEKYGPTLGIAYHHYSTLYHMCMGNYLAEISPSDIGVTYPSGNSGQPQNPGNLLLTGEDGSQVLASPYRSNAGSNVGEYCWLAVGVQPNINYTVQHYDMFQTVTMQEKLFFNAQEGDVKLKANLQ